MRLFGRDDETARLDDLLDGATHGRGTSLLIEGDAGIGKSALAASLRDRAEARGFVVLSCQGTRAGTEAGFAGLHQLLRPALSHLGELPDRQRMALEVAFGVSVGAAPDGLVLNIAALGLVEELLAETAVLIVVEDLHWLDRSTVDVVTFLAARWGGERAMLVATTRPDERIADWSRSFAERMEPSPLADLAAREMLSELWPQLSAARRANIVAESSGNPLALTEFAAESSAHVSVPSARRGRLTMSRRLEWTFLSETATLPERTRRMLLVAAAGEDSPFDEVVAASRALGLDPLDLVPAERARILAVQPGGFAFRHPLISSALYDSADSASRAAAHRALASVATDPGRAARHEAAATFGQDEGVASALDEVAAAAVRQGARAEATDSWRRAAELTPDPSRRATRLTLAAESARQGGDAATAIELAGVLRTAPLEPETLRQLVTTEWILSQTTTYPGRSVRELVEIAEALPEASERIEMLVFAAVRSFILQEPTEVANAVARSLRDSGVSEDDAFSRIGLSLVDPTTRAPIESMLPSFRRQLSPSDAMLLNCLAFSAESSADLVGALRVWDTAQHAFHEQTRTADESTALCGRGGLRITAGLITSGLADAEVALRLSLDLDLDVVGAMAAAEIARARARRGEREEAAAALATSVRLSGGVPFARIEAMQAWASGILALGDGAWSDAVRHMLRTSVNESVGLWAGLDLVEACVRAGEPELVGPWLAGAEAAASRTRSARLSAIVAGARALTSRTEDVRGEFERALGLAQDAGAHFDLARLRLHYGSWLRRERHIVEARTQLRGALAGFQAESLSPLVTRAAAELRAAGENDGRERAPGGSDPTAVLTAQELQVARLAAQGMTNKEIADQVYLSHRTVGAHLHRAFAKLGLTRRGQLSALLSD